MDPVLVTIGIAVALGVLAVGAFVVLRKRSTEKAEEPAGRRRVNLGGPAPRENLPAGARRRRGVDRLRRAREAENERQDEEGEGSGEDDLFDYIAQPEGKIGAKKMAKLEEKARRRAEREDMEREREERKEREALLEGERRREEAKLKKLEEEKEEEARIAREEKEKRDYEEYLAIKSEFNIEEEGTDAVMESDEAELLQRFIEHIKKMKVVIVDELASHFNIKTQAAIERIESLMSDGTLTGVLDDRGKFIYITRDELEAVASFIRQRGRVSIQELAESSNRLVRLSPDTEQISSSAASS